MKKDYLHILNYILGKTIENKNVHLEKYPNAKFLDKNVVRDEDIIKEFGIEQFEVDMMRYELSNNAYINGLTGNATLKGIEFFNDGGFIQQKKDKRRNRIIDIIQIWSVIFGGTFAFLYYFDQLTGGTIHALFSAIKSLFVCH